MNLSIWKMIEVGGIWLWVLLGLSIMALAVAFERLATLWSYMARARTLGDTVNRCLSRGAVAEGRAACERSKSPLAEVFLIGFERLGRSSRDALEAAVDRERQKVTLDLRNRLWILGSIGALSPFIGLAGTVVGIMNAFGAIAERGQSGFPVVSRALSEALVTTAAGILVAVEAVVIYNYFMQRLQRFAVEIKILVDEFLESLREVPESQMGEAKDGARQAS